MATGLHAPVPRTAADFALANERSQKTSTFAATAQAVLGRKCQPFAPPLPGQLGELLLIPGVGGDVRRTFGTYQTTESISESARQVNLLSTPLITSA